MGWSAARQLSQRRACACCAQVEHEDGKYDMDLLSEDAGHRWREMGTESTDDDAADELVGKEVQIFWQDPHGWFDAKIISWSWALDENGARVRMHEVRVGRGRGWGGVLHASSHSGVRVLAVHRLSTRMASTTWTCCPKTLAIGGARWARSQLTTVTAVLQKTKLKTVRTSGSASAAGSASGASSIAG